MLEYWFKERRTLVDFRRGPLGPYFDGLAARLKERGYSHNHGCHILAKCCLFNSFLVDQGITRSKEIRAAHFQAFMDAYFADFRTTSCYVARNEVWGMLKPLFSYLIDEGVLKPVKPKPSAGGVPLGPRSLLAVFARGPQARGRNYPERAQPVVSVSRWLGRKGHTQADEGASGGVHRGIYKTISQRQPG